MLAGKKIIVVMPAYNAEHTIARTYREIPHDIVDEVLVVDDHSSDATAAVVRQLGIQLVVHSKNRGYGANQKTCYQEALRRNADIIVMLHPDYQYPPRLITAMGAMLVADQFDIVLGSRILSGSARAGGMPLYKYIANRYLTLFQNLLLGQKLSEYHTGYRAFTADVLRSLPLEENSNDFLFDNEILAQSIHFGYRIGEITSPASYHAQASSISLLPAIRYGIGVLRTTLAFVTERSGLVRHPIFDRGGRKLED